MLRDLSTSIFIPPDTCVTESDYSGINVIVKAYRILLNIKKYA